MEESKIKNVEEEEEKEMTEEEKRSEEINKTLKGIWEECLRLKEEEIIYNITDIFTTSQRDFLLRSNGDKVKLDSLKGKIVGIHFWRVSDVIKHPEVKVAVNLLDAYDEHYSKGDFEVVSVAIMEEGEVGLINAEEEAFFNQQFSRMPWLAIPFSDIEARRKLTKAFVIPFLFRFQSCSFLDANGRLLMKHADQLLYEHAAACYPFTRQRANEVISDKEHNWQLEVSSLQSLLASPDRDFVISNQGNKIPISNLKGKVVGLYLYGSEISIRLLPKLKYIYNKLKVTRGGSFEIVFVNLHFTDYGYGDEESFKKAFGNMPWLALPFKDKMCRRLWQKYNRFAEVSCSPGEDGVFVVISSNGKSVDPYAAKVIIEYGVQAYPFTREKAAKIEEERLKQKRILPRIMAYQGSLIRKDGDKVHVAKIFGKNILLFIGAEVVSSTQNFLPELVRWYKEIKNKDDNFEVIYLSRDPDRATFNYVFQKMPWLTFPFRSKNKLVGMLNDVEEEFSSNRCYLIALGRDGRIFTKDAAKHLRIRGADAYPFTDKDLLKDVTLELATRLVWTLKDEKGRAYIPNYEPGLYPRYSNDIGG